MRTRHTFWSKSIISFFLLLRSYVNGIIFCIGWKVLLTSRNEGVALRADPKCLTLKPDFLTFEESWRLFQKIVFPKETNIRRLSLLTFCFPC